MNRIGIDVGGTFIKGGIIDNKGNILFSTKVPTFNNNEKISVVDNLYNLINYLLEKNKSISDVTPSFIGLGIPGIVNRKKGLAEFSGNLSWNNVPIIELLKEKGINIPMKICNDSRSACIGEMMFGAGVKYKNTVVMTIGTGIGAGIVINGKLFEGNGDKGGEIGHSLLMMDGELCTCGRQGCFEAYASAKALIRYTKEELLYNKNSLMWNHVYGEIENVDGALAFTYAKLGDKSANNVINKYVKYLSEGILNICNCFRPEVIIIGGGISEAGDFLFEKINAYIAERNYGYKCTPPVNVIQAKLGNSAGMIGAAFMNEFLKDDDNE